MFSKTRQFANAVLALAFPYWVSQERWRARGLLAVIIAMNLGIVYVNVLFSDWNNRFYNALQQHDFSRFLHELGYFCVLAAVFIVVAVYQTYLTQMLEIRWRTWLTGNYLDDWLGEHAYYRLQLGAYRADNPDQRIADDLRLFVEATLTLTVGLIGALATLASFSAILWRLSGTIQVPLGASHLPIPGYMLWAALVYAVCGTWLTHRIGKPLIGLNFQQQQFEANFRFSLARLRENTEGVALYRGEREETRSLTERLGNIVTNWWAIMRRQKRLTWFTAGYSQAAIVFPVLAAAPRYFSGAIGLGALMQTMYAFGQVQSALSWFVTAYTQVAQWKATTDRLTGFRDAIRTAKSRSGAPGIHWRKTDRANLAMRDLHLTLPDGARLTGRIDAEVRAGERWLVTGPTGAGKSTLLRALAGIWPFGRGTIEIPDGVRALFLPQKPYLPIGTLRSVLSYPDPSTAFDEHEMADALTACGLPSLAGRLDESRHWALELSPGEQQRLAFARALLQRPAWLFLDEATASLDEASEQMLYRLISHELPGATIVSVAHRSALAAFHDRRLGLGRSSHGPAHVLRQLTGTCDVRSASNR
ncbi:MAG TPA: ABC transporter ATP-binding protein/permease [Casimicrobiaceae bacterium]|nr:ABC transporter ATP-binding protein/permease [Casimicrobiaceae bacterium]